MPPSIPPEIRRIDAGAEYLGEVPEGSVWQTCYSPPSGIERDCVYVSLSVGIRPATERDMGRITR